MIIEERKFHQLKQLGAGALAHLNDDLLSHLQGTRDLLTQWSAPAVLVDAGLYHAVYGTDGFDQALVSTRQRAAIAAIIGIGAETIVYHYCACINWGQMRVFKLGS
ncbi:hypothetical protein N9498_01135 [Porticoccaceae bacterium]|nr:hypothetical protein [Porticoccaceae bacterium]